MEEPSIPADPKSEDPFYSPENHKFYSAFKYVNLNPATNEIRLLRLLPGDNNVVRCDFIQPIRLDDAPDYNAIFYCAGDPKHTKTICVDGLSMNVFASLADALRRLGSSIATPKESIVVWADQICINQNDFNERANQLGKMRDIYRGASRTVVWLGSTYDDGLQALQAIYQDIFMDIERQSFQLLQRILKSWNKNRTLIGISYIRSQILLVGTMLPLVTSCSIGIKSKGTPCFALRLNQSIRYSMLLGGLGAGSGKKS